MCLGDRSQTVFDVFKHHTSLFLLLLFICLRKRLLILSKCNRSKVFTAVQRCKRFWLKEKYFLWEAVGISGLMANPKRAEQCPECRAKVPKESNFPGWIQDKAIDLCDVSSGIVPRIHPKKKKAPLLHALVFLCLIYKEYFFHLPFQLVSLHTLLSHYAKL